MQAPCTNLINSILSTPIGNQKSLGAPLVDPFLARPPSLLLLRLVVQDGGYHQRVPLGTREEHAPFQ